MLHPVKNTDNTSSESMLSNSNGVDDLEQLRKLLLGSEYQDLIKLQHEFSSHSHTSNKISKVISEAIAIRSKQDGSISQALVPSIEDAINISAKRDPKRLANALFPVIGPAIRESVAETVSAMMQQVNQLLENSLSARSIKWRINAFRTKRSFAEVMLSETVIYQVEQVFLIHRESSLLINHLTSASAIVKDPDMVSSMLTAVTDFVKDSFVVDKQQNVKSIKFGQLNLLFEAGPHAIIVVAVRGLIPSDLQVTIREQVEELHRLYASKLETYDGNAEQFPDTYVQLEKCLLSKKKNEQLEGVSKKKLPWAAIVVISLLMLLPFAWWLMGKLEENKWNKIVEQLQAEPGIVILNHHKHDGGYVVNGLRDPLSNDPAGVVSSHPDFSKSVQWDMEPYYSNESNIVQRRVLSILNPPVGVEATFSNGQLLMKGEAEKEWITGLTNKLPYIWGINSVDSSQLKAKPNIKLEIQQLVGLIEDVVIEFSLNSSELSSNDLNSIDDVYQYIKNLQILTDKVGQSFKIGILGFSDATGTSSVNVLLSDNRARNIHQVLAEKGLIEESMLAKGLGSYAVRSEIAGVSKCPSQRCVMFEVYLK